MTTKAALRGLFLWMTGANKEGNPYMHKPVTDAILVLTRGKSRYDIPKKQPPKGGAERALHDLATLATSGSRHGNPYTKREVRAASSALGGDGYDIP